MTEKNVFKPGNGRKFFLAIKVITLIIFLINLIIFKENPFRERISEVFTQCRDPGHSADEGICFEEFLEMMSVFSDQAPRDLKVHYAFKIYGNYIFNLYRQEIPQYFIKFYYIQSDSILQISKNSSYRIPSFIQKSEAVNRTMRGSFVRSKMKLYHNQSHHRAFSPFVLYFKSCHLFHLVWKFFTIFS